MKVSRLSNCAYYLKYHIVWVCKYRRRVLNPEVCSYLQKVLPKLLRSLPGVELELIGFDLDHLHMLLVIPPKYSFSEVMGRLKGQSASRIRNKFKWFEKVYWEENVVWSPGYFVSSEGLDETKIKQYVEYQGKKDSGQLQLGL